MSNILEYPTYNLYKKAYDSLTIYGYREFLQIIKKDELLDNLSDDNKKLYFDFINSMYNIRLDIQDVKPSDINKYDIVHNDHNLLFMCYILYFDDLDIFERYINFFTRELKIDINPLTYYFIDNRIFHYEKLKRIFDLLIRCNLIIDEKLLDCVRKSGQNKLFDYLCELACPEVKDPGFE